MIRFSCSYKNIMTPYSLRMIETRKDQEMIKKELESIFF